MGACVSRCVTLPVPGLSACPPDDHGPGGRRVSSSHRFEGPLGKRPPRSSLAPTGAAPQAVGDLERASGPKGAKGLDFSFKWDSEAAGVQPELGAEPEGTAIPVGLHTASGVEGTLPQPLGGVARSVKGSSGSPGLTSDAAASASGGRTVWVAPATAGAGSSTRGHRPVLSHPHDLPPGPPAHASGHLERPPAMSGRSARVLSLVKK